MARGYYHLSEVLEHKTDDVRSRLAWPERLKLLLDISKQLQTLHERVSSCTYAITVLFYCIQFAYDRNKDVSCTSSNCGYGFEMFFFSSPLTNKMSYEYVYVK